MTTDNLVTPAPSDTPASTATPATPETLAGVGAPAAPSTATPPTGQPETVIGAETPATKPGETIVSDDKPVDVKGDWPDNWRDLMAKGDEKLRKRLDRFTDPQAVTKSWLAAEQKISSGEFKAKLPDNATPEQITEYRKENGIPETPEGYDLNLGNGLVVGEADKPMVNEFLKEMHGVNASPSVVKSALAAYYKIQENALATQAESDRAARTAAEDSLRADFGADYRMNVNVLKNYMATLPEGLRANLEGARLSDGTPMFNSPDAVKYFLQKALDANPAATVVPNSATPGVSIDQELASLQKMMGSAAWYKDTNAQKRYMELTEAQVRLNARK